jgi:hypothetical protein
MTLQVYLPYWWCWGRFGCMAGAEDIDCHPRDQANESRRATLSRCNDPGDQQFAASCNATVLQQQGGWVSYLHMRTEASLPMGHRGLLVAV